MSLHVITVMQPSRRGEAAVNPYVVGAHHVSRILLALIVVLLMFGAGREHS